MFKTLLTLCHNITASSIGKASHCKALFPLYHITPFCNLGCAYCDGFPELGLPRELAAGRDRVDRDRYQLSTGGVKELLGILKKRFDFMFITGGEPLVRNDIEEVMQYAGFLGFHGVSLSTNSILLPRVEHVLEHVSNLIISCDMLDAGTYAGILGCGRETAQAIIRNVERYKELEKKYGYKLSVHAVILPGKVELAEEVLDFCRRLGITICLSPLQIHYRAHDSFAGDAAYRNLIARVVDLKLKGEKISGTIDYYTNIGRLEPFRCIPVLIPRILPNGNILYPCRPRGTVGGNVLRHGSWDRAWEEARRTYGGSGSCDRSCRIRCYIEPSLLMKNPVSMVREFIDQV